MDPVVQQKINELETGKQSKNHGFVDGRAPIASEVPEFGVVYAMISGTMYLYTRKGATLYRVAMT
jgi:hypothetical protein